MISVITILFTNVIIIIYFESSKRNLSARARWSISSACSSNNAWHDHGHGDSDDHGHDDSDYHGHGDSNDDGHDVSDDDDIKTMVSTTTKGFYPLLRTWSELKHLLDHVDGELISRIHAHNRPAR